MPETNPFRRCFLAIEHKVLPNIMYMTISFQVARNLHSKMYHSLALKENSKLLKEEVSGIFLRLYWIEDSLCNFFTKF